MLGLFSTMDVWPKLGALYVILGHTSSRTEAGSVVMQRCGQVKLE